ncbi:SLC13 family permease [Caulifigura coniformis]|uniref:SLC13 family permease n=1 Tax=Caulifigura coniformis TaxID=2527983 RepID=UPI001E3FD9C4|nr:DASS family sodium-coupled anion symporter [Caulifigura coniformis]
MPSSPWYSFRNPETGRARRPILFAICVCAALLVAVWLRPDQSLSPAALRALFILVLAVLLWATEVIPAFAVGLLVIALNVALLGRPQGVYAQDANDWEQFVTVFGHPLIWLFFGGFVLAAGMEKCGLDRRLAMTLLQRLGGRYENVLLGVMLATFVLSLCMSGTATAAMMLAVIAPLMRQCDQESNAGKGLLLGIAVASILGGVGSLIAKPPNAIAAGALSALEPPQVITVLQWMALGLPPSLIVAAIVWKLLTRWFPEPDRVFRFESIAATQAAPANRAQYVIVVVTLVSTIGLWLTSSWHGIPTSAVSLLPTVLLTSTGVLTAKDIRGLSYDVLFLMAGGLALGNVVTSTGLSNWIIGQIPMGALPPIMLAFVLSYATTVLANFMSATATANILVPLVITMAAGSEALVVIAVAIGASCGMCLPVASPSNAMVYTTGRLKIGDLIRVGLVVGLLCPLISVTWLWLCLDRVMR